MDYILSKNPQAENRSKYILNLKCTEYFVSEAGNPHWKVI